MKPDTAPSWWEDRGFHGVRSFSLVVSQVRLSTMRTNARSGSWNNVSISGDMLTIKGEKRAEEEEDASPYEFDLIINACNS